MRVLRSAVLYTALVLGANTAVAGPEVLQTLRTGEMEKLVPTAEPVPLPEATLTDPEGGERSLAEYRGKYVVLNFWATWCAPCREEMPALQSLQDAKGGERFAVVTVATGRNAVPGIERFFAENGITTLPKLRDPRQELARAMGVLGLPVTVLVDPEGREIARLTGGADWAAPEALALIDGLLAD